MTAEPAQRADLPRFSTDCPPAADPRSVPSPHPARFRSALARAALAVVLLAAGLLPSACTAPPLQRPRSVTYRVENVRGTPQDDGSEINRIIAVINKFAVEEVDCDAKRASPLLGHERFYDYELSFNIANLRDLVDIDRDLSRLFHDNAGPDGMRFQLTDAGLTYRSNQVNIGTEVALRGVTAPGATVRLRVGDEVVDVRADKNGLWRHALVTTPSNPFIYGFSEDAASRMRRYFRINLLSQAQEAVSERAYAGMFPDDVGG